MDEPIATPETPTGGRHYVLLCSCPSSAVAEQLAALLVEKQAAACVNILPGVTSVYRWQGQIEKDKEVLLIIKSSGEGIAQTTELVQQHHPYDLPELIALPITAGSQAYLNWIDESICAS
jgi:periplasmic divalent cation tolerance protein